MNLCVEFGRLNKTSIVLASASPRRIEILSLAGIEFDVVPSDVDEEQIFKRELSQCSVTDLAQKLSYAKAESVSKQYLDKLVIGADTLVSIQNHIMGKPLHRKEVKQFIKQLSGKVHQVVTGFTLIHQKSSFQLSNYGLTNVLVRELSEEEIEDYSLSDDGLDAAGAYKIQGLFSKHIRKIEGSYHNVVGLPIDLVYDGILDFLKYKFTRNNE